MLDSDLSKDNSWPRASQLFAHSMSSSDVAIVGVPAHLTSLSKTSANQTPTAIRAALARYSSYAGARDIDLTKLSFSDLGDIEDPDHSDGEARVVQALLDARERHTLLIALGGDNSITYSVATALWSDISEIGIITLDAHHDLRDGNSNGSPIWRLIQRGVQGKNIVQIGISDFANSAEYSQRAKDHGINIIYRNALRTRPMSDVMAEAFELAGSNGREIYVDLDVDVCDRAAVPACPASVPGGIGADELRQAAFLAGADKRVRALDITEIDATKDSRDERTIRLGALLVLEASVGVALRKS
jgi:formiminoglutamase